MAWAPDYTTVNALADYLRIGDTDDDVELALAISAASRAVDRATNRQFGLVDVPQQRYYTPLWNQQGLCWFVDIDDVMIVTGFEVFSDTGNDGSYAYQITNYDLTSRNALANDRPYTRLVPRNGVGLLNRPESLRVTARWGWLDVPATVEQATLLQASRFFSRRNAPFGVAGSPDAGSEMRLLAKVDPDVQVMLSKYVRWWGVR